MSDLASIPLSWDLESSPFHPGELQIQRRAGVEEKAALGGRRSMRRYLTPQHREFFPLLPMVFLGSVAADGQPWASMVMGRPGFIQAPDPHQLRFATTPLFGDILNITLRPDAPLAALGIEFPTRRRNRAIGVVDKVGEHEFTLSVHQTLGICAKYIQGRETIYTADPRHPEPRPLFVADALDDVAMATIMAADCFFVASNDPKACDGTKGGPDISHRGGRPGFVRIDDARTLTTPDFVGNFMFNTLGNITVEPRVGLLFVDFENADILQIAAEAEVIWDGEEVRSFAGAQRLVRLHINTVRRVEKALPARFSRPDYSPFLLHTGSWADAVTES